MRGTAVHEVPTGEVDCVAALTPNTRPPARPLPAQVGVIEALPRDVTGSRSAQWARAHKLIPGIIHGVGADGVDDVELVYVRDADLRREVGRRGQAFSNTLFDVCVG